MLYFVYDLDDDDNNNNNHEAFASTLRSDSVATLDSSHTVSTSFFSVCLTDQQHRPHRTNSNTNFHQVRVLIDAIISHTAPRLHQKNTNVNFHVK